MTEDVDRLQAELAALMGEPTLPKTAKLAKPRETVWNDHTETPLPVVDYDKPAPVSGKRCLGVKFEAGGGVYRTCGWDGTSSPYQEDGEQCKNCERTVGDRVIGEMTGEKVIPVNAMHVYVADENNRPGIWVLVESPA